MSDFAALVKVPVQGSGSNEYGKLHPQGVWPWRRRDPRSWLGILACAMITPVCAVTPPVFLPSDADSVGKFNVQVTASPGTTIRYTLTGAEPTQYDRTIASGSSIAVDRTMTLKAKAWSGSESSATTSTLLKVTGQVDGGSETLLALKTNGKLFGWGSQDYGRLSNGSTVASNVMSPIALVPASGGTVGTATRVAAGSRHTLYLDASGKVYASGRNGSGECGRPGNTNSEILNANNVLNSSTTTDHLASCLDVAAGLDFSMALTSAGKVMTWGSQTSGRLANGFTASGSRNNAAVAKISAGTSPAGDLTNIVQIAAGKDFALAREANPSENASGTGQVWLWGEGSSNCLTTGNTNDVGWATKAKLDNLTNPTTSYLNYALDMDASDLHAAVVRWKANDSDLQRTVWTMGSRLDGRIGDNGAVTGTQTYPTKVVMANGSPLIDITQVATGPSHTLALDKNGKVWAWGSNSNGALGDNDTTGARNYAAPVRNGTDTDDLADIVWVGAGGGLGSTAGYSLAIAGDGKVYIWGSNPNGVFGNGSLTPASANFPREIPSFRITPGFPTITLNTQVTSANAPGAATITATVDDPDGSNTIQKVDFYLQGGTPITKTTNPWSIYPNNLAQGSYHAYAIVRDTDGNETASLPTTFEVGPTLDTDSDGLLDSWEMTHFGNLNQTGSGDSDGDKVTNLQEHTQGSNPTTATDANADGIPDDWVTWQLSLPGGVTATTLAPNADPDQDELTNLVEYQLNTKARHFDSDSDGQSDWQEVSQATDPNNASSLAAPLEVSAYQGASGPTLPLSLTNPATGLGYNLTLSGNIPTGAGYLMTSSNVAGGPAYEWIDISTTGEHLTGFNTDRYSLVQRAIPFGFSLYGTSYSNLFVSGYGFITMINPGQGGDGFPLTFRAPLPNTDGHMSLIAPYEQYLEPDVSGAIYYQAFSDKVVVQWEQVKVTYANAVVLVSFQAVIYPDGSIRFNYKSIPPATGNINIVGYLAGIQNATGTDGIGASWYTGGAQQGLQIHNLDPLSIRFAHPVGTPWVTTSTGTVSGNPLGWNLLFDSDELALGLHEATMKIGKAGGPVLYSRPIKLTISENPDVDGDGLPNTWETTYGFNPNDNGSVNPVNGPLGDPDGDKVTNLQEYLQGTNPTVSTDANADGIPDHWVTWQLSLPGGVAASSLAPNADPDQDELTNLVEFQRNTKARHIDSDGDGQSDWQEVAQNTDPNSASSKVAALQVLGYQAMPDLVVPQTLANPVPALGYDVNLTGNGGATPWVTASVANANGNPLSWNLVFKGAGLPLGVQTGTFELRKATGPVLYTRTIEFTVAQDPDTDGDGMSDPWEIQHGFNPNDNGSGSPAQGPLGDPDGDKVTNLQEYLLGTNPTVAADANADGLPDDWVAWQLSLPGGVAATTLAPNEDPDQDELTNLVEYQLNTKARHIDSDGDGQSDWQEVAQNTDPTNAGSTASTLAVTSYPGTTALRVPLSLVNPAAAVGYDITLTGNGGGTPWVISSAASVSGDPLAWDLVFDSGSTLGTRNAVLELRKPGGLLLYSRGIALTVTSWPATSGNDTLQGTNGNDQISALSGDDTVNGEAGNDQIDGGSGNDVIRGGQGDDTMAGSDGKDSYYYELGDGNDTLTDIAGIHQANDATADYSDLYFGEGIEPGMLRSSYLPADGSNPTARLKLEVVDPAGGSITITNWNIQSGSTGVYVSRRWRFHFTDGTVWSGTLFWNEDLTMPFQGFTGGIRADLLTGSQQAEGFRGLEGDDFMEGAEGSDSYHYQWGGGDDTISDNPGTGDLSLLYIQGVDLESHLTYDFVPPADLRINVSHPSDSSKDGSVTIREWYRTNPIQYKDNWRIYAQGSGGEWIDLSLGLRYSGTNGPDVVSGLPSHTSNGQTFDAGAGDDVIHGSYWGETILGNLGNDTLYGEAGNDTLEGGSGDDSLNGGADNDTLRGEAGEDLLEGEAGSDSLFGGDGFDVLRGGSGNDLLEGGAGDDVLSGDDGDDTLRGGTGNDDLKGGTGSDVYEWNLGDGYDTISDSISDPASNVENHLVFGTGVEPGRISLSPGPNNSLLVSVKDAGNQEIGRVTINDWFTRVSATSGNGNHSKSWRISFASDSTIWDGRFLATPGPDRILGTAGADSLVGGLGNDTLEGFEGADSLAGDEGDDALFGGTGDDNLLGGAGKDTLSGGDGVDVLFGGDGSDSIRGDAGNDEIHGGLGNDTLDGGPGSDTYHWVVGDGNDVLSEHPSSIGTGDANTISFSGEVAPGVEISSQYVKVTSTELGYGFFSIFNPAGDQIGLITVKYWDETKGSWKVKFPQGSTASNWGTLSALEDPDLGGAYDIDPGEEPADGVTGGSNLDDLIGGGAGNDVLNGLEGDDLISGSSGNDILHGGDGSDIIGGGDGDDTITGGNDSDIVHGGNGNDVIDGGAGDDLLTGGLGNDRITGGAGNDRILGEEGDDTLQGGAGDDTIVGGPGDDLLSGESGSDVYLWNLGDGNDTIQDTAGENAGSPDVNVVNLGPGIELQQIRQEFVPASGDHAAFLKISIVDESELPVGSIAVNFPDPLNQVSDLGLKVRTYTGKVVSLATPGNDVLMGSASDYRIDALAGDDEIRTFAGNDTVVGGEGNDFISCGTGMNTITGGPGNDVIVLTREAHLTSGRTDTIHYELGDGHDRIINGMPEHVGEWYMTADLKFGEGISPDDCTFELIEDHSNNTASIKVVVHNDEEQVVGSILVERAFALNSGELSGSGPEPVSDYVSFGSWKTWRSGASFDDYAPEEAARILKIEFADGTPWKLGTGWMAPGAIFSYEGGPSDIDRDGMDDQWEITYGLDPLWRWPESNDDPDEDGLNNYQEYLLRKNPLVPDADTPLMFEATGSDGDVMSIAYENQNGLNNAIDDSMDDKDGDGFPNGWEYIRGTRADDSNDFPAPDYIVDQANGNLSITDNIVSTLGEAARLANQKRGGTFQGFSSNSIIQIKSGTYLESVGFNGKVLLYGEAGANGEVPTILGPRDIQTILLTSSSGWIADSPDSLISGVRISHVSGKKGPAIFSEEELHLRGVIIDHNVSDYGSAIFGNVTSLDHCTIFNNTSPGGVYFAYWNSEVEIRNSILWGNSDPALMAQCHLGSEDPIVYTVEDSIIEGGFMGALNQDPMLHRSGTLSLGSPAIDVITPPSGVPQPRDIHGEDRSQDGMSDIGADEYCDRNGSNDTDGIPDWVESAVDGDTLTSVAEYSTHLTDPFLTDSDFDGLSDDAEILIHFTNPNLADTDSDGITDGNEVRIGTSPIVANNDGDTLPDEWEFDHGLNPNSNDALSDLDGDGLTNAQEFALGTNPNAKDTDGDGMSDDWELAHSQDPRVFDTSAPVVVADADSDGMTIWAELEFGSSDQESDTESDGLSDAFEFSGGTSATNADSDGDSILDLDEDSDGDGLSNREELETYLTIPVSKDTDGDGITDSQEVSLQMDPLNPADGESDADGDGLSKSKELSIGTDSSVADSDQDGIPDGLEYSGGLNPLVADSDSDGVLDLDEDTDGDGVSNRDELLQSTHMLYRDTDMDGIDDTLAQ